MRFLNPSRRALAVTCLLVWPVWLAQGACVAVSAQPLHLVHIAEGRVTVDAQEASLLALVEEIARQTGLELEGEESLTGTVTVRLRRQPLELALPLILGDRRYVLMSPSDRGGAAEPRPGRLRLFASPPTPGGTASADAAGGHSAPTSPLASLETGAEPLDRMDAIDALVESDDPIVVRRLGLAALHDPDKSVRAAAVEALGVLGGRPAVEMLELALRDRAIDIREDAVGALRRIGGNRAARGLTAAIQDRSAEVRLLAVDALGAIGGTTAIQLLEYVRAVDRDADLRAAADEWITDLVR
jgi:hypothetical protein